MRAVVLLLGAVVGGCSAPLKFEVDAGSAAHEATVPLTLERNRALLEAEVNGHAITLLLDLGADVTIGLLPATADRVSAVFTGDTKSVSDAFGRVTRERRYALARCSLGGFELRDVEGWEHGGDLSSKERHVDGIVGWRLLEKFGVLIDFPGRRLVLAPAGTTPAGVDPARWIELPVARTDDGLSAAVVVEGRPLDMILDTGATWSVLKAGPVDEHGWGDRCVDRNGVPFFRASLVSVAIHELGPLDFAVLDLEHPQGEGVLGFNFFALRALWIDWAAGRAALAGA